MTLFLTCLFSLVALGGLYLLSYVLWGKNTPKGVALIHGGAGVLGLIILSVAAFFNHKLFYVFILFAMAVLGGLILFMCDLKGKKIFKSLALAHGLFAIAGLIILVCILIQEYT